MFGARLSEIKTDLHDPSSILWSSFLDVSGWPKVMSMARDILKDFLWFALMYA